MHRSRHILFAIATGLLLFATGLQAQVNFTASTSHRKVGVGQPFRITFSLANGNGKNFRLPSIQNVQILSGPNQQVSTRIINGDYSQSISYSIDMRALKAGSVKIPPASVTVDGQEYNTGELTIEVTNDGSGEQQNSEQDGGESSNQGMTLARLKASPSEVYQGQELLLTQILQSRQQLADLRDFRPPELEGFMSYDIEQKGPITLRNENYNGANYQTADLRKQVLFPQKSGKLKIQPMEVECVVREQTRRSRDFFDQFFGGGYKNTVVKVKSDPITIQVKPLPEDGKPDHFKGAVGDYQMKTEVDKTSLKANEALTLKVTISGKGNLKIIDAPEIDFPTDFEVYDPKISQNIQVNESGVSGKITFEYVLIPRHGGTYTIPSFSFDYFNPNRATYVTLSSEEYSVEVEKGNGESDGSTFVPGKEDVQIVGQDIRFIHNGVSDLTRKGKTFFGSTAFTILMILPLLFVFLAAWQRRKKQEALRDVAGNRSKKAEKVARTRLSKAAQLLKENNRDAYYEEVLRTLWNYTGHRLHIAMADLNKENATTALQKSGVSNETTGNLIALIHQCEFARYAPPGSSHEMQDDFSSAINVIRKIEEEMK